MINTNSSSQSVGIYQDPFLVTQTNYFGNCIINKMKALIIVDVQNDFCEGGTLEVKGSSSIFPFINQLVKFEDFEKIFITKDWHPAHHSSFAVNRNMKPFESTKDSNGNQEIVWPVHCVQYTRGAQLYPLLDLEGKKAIEIKKGYIPTEESYSGFGTEKNPTKLTRILKRNSISEVVVVGLALDFCVGNTAIDAIKAGFKATVIKQATKQVSKQSAELMINRFNQEGVNFVSFKEIEDQSHKTLESSDDSSTDN